MSGCLLRHQMQRSPPTARRSSTTARARRRCWPAPIRPALCALRVASQRLSSASALVDSAAVSGSGGVMRVHCCNEFEWTGRAAVAVWDRDDPVRTRKSPKPSSCDAVARRSGEQRIERGEDRGLVDVLAVQRVEALAAVIGTEHQVVAAGRLADQRDLAEVRPRAAVRAAADAQVDRRVVDAVAREQRLDLRRPGPAGSVRPRPSPGRRSGTRRRRARCGAAGWRVR